MEKLEAQSLSALLQVEFPPQKWLVDKIIPDGGLVLMSAAPASFKTWIALELCLCIADKRPLFDEFQTTSCGVLVADEESGERMLQDRFKKLGAKIAEKPWEEKPIFYLSRIGRQIDDDYIKELIDECEKNLIKMVIFDSLVRFHSARENDAGEMSKILNLFKVLNDNGITVLVLHHNRKGTGEASEMVRGSSDILAACDVHLSIARRERRVTITQTKNRYMEELKPFTVKLEQDGNRSSFSFIGYEDDKESQLLKLKQSIIKQVADTPGINKSQLIGLISESTEGMSLNRITKVITELIDNDTIRAEQGAKNSLRLFIAEQEE